MRKFWVKSRKTLQVILLKYLEEKRSLMKSEDILRNIGDAIKKKVPFEAVMPSEKISPPTVGDLADCTDSNTIHVDEFLYDKDEFEDMTQKKKIQLHYCVDCNSRNIKELIYVSHSMSKSVMMFIFKVVLPKDLEGKTFIDIGSRLGSVLYGAYYLSNVSTIMGIEMNKECCDVQEEIIDQFSMNRNRIKVIHSDVLDKKDIITTADIVIFNAVDFFVDNEKHKEIWYFLKANLQKGCFVLLNRSIASILLALNIIEEFKDWLTISKCNNIENELFFNVEDYTEIFLYTVN
uniref:DOT1 domain-containing protein n=1 Tax=Bombyx mori TaxID=7091 RepID=A0A8R2GAP7_BOMMO|nr:uncharacterized protein LOC101745966 isoform X2 [Bombyx mori]